MTTSRTPSRSTNSNNGFGEWDNIETADAMEPQKPYPTDQSASYNTNPLSSIKIDFYDSDVNNKTEKNLKDTSELSFTTSPIQTTDATEQKVTNQTTSSSLSSTAIMAETAKADEDIATTQTLASDEVKLEIKITPAESTETEKKQNTKTSSSTASITSAMSEPQLAQAPQLITNVNYVTVVAPNVSMTTTEKDKQQVANDSYCEMSQTSTPLESKQHDTHDYGTRSDKIQPIDPEKLKQLFGNKVTQLKPTRWQLFKKKAEEIFCCHSNNDEAERSQVRKIK